MEVSVQDLLKQVTASFEQSSAEFSKKADEAIRQAKSAGDISVEAKAAIDKIATEHNLLMQAQHALKAQLGEVEQAVATMPAQRILAQAKSIGSQVVAFEALKQFAADVRGNMRSRISVPVQAALLSPDLPDGVIAPQRLPEIDAAPKPRLFIRDLIAGGNTASNAIFWVQMTGFTNAAAAVVEGAAKPYSNIAFEPKVSPVKTIAHMFKASKQVLDDFAQLSSLIDAEMRFGLRQVEEAEILFGDGTGAHLEGIVPQATAYSAVGIPASPTVVDHIRWAMLQAQLARIPATGHVLHFTDWAKIELMKDELGRYIIGNPQGAASPTLWALPVVATDSPGFVDQFLTGSFMYGAQIFDREEANVVISTENVDDFEKNMVSIRCEERLALIVKRPEAFIWGHVSGTQPPPPAPAPAPSPGP